MRYFFLLVLVFIGIQSQAQYAEWLQSDRGGAGIGPFTVGKNTLQIEAGWSITDQLEEYSKAQGYKDEFESNHLTANLYKSTFRLGIIERIEASVGIGYQFERNEFSNPSYTGKDNFIDQIEVALRGNIYQGKGAIPAVGLEVKAAFPKPETCSKIIISTALALQSALTDKLSLSANVFVGDEIEIPITASYQFTDKLGAFIDYDPRFLGGYYANNFHFSEAFGGAGVTYYLGRNFQVDMGATILLHQYKAEKSVEVSNYFGFQAGLSSRLNWRD